MTNSELFFASRSAIVAGYIFLRTDLDLNVDYMFAQDNSLTNKQVYTPYYVEDSTGNPFVYLLVMDYALTWANPNTLVFEVHRNTMDKVTRAITTIESY